MRGHLSWRLHSNLGCQIIEPHLYSASMKQIFLALLVVCVGCSTPESNPSSTQTLVFGGTILTMDANRPTVEAMLLEGETIAAVGTLADLEAQAPRATRYDLAGRTVLPGIVDSHVHVHELGHDQRKANLMGTTSVAEMIERLQTFYPSPSAGQWLIGAGWDEGVWGSMGYPDRAELDAAFPDNPVALESLHGFGGFYNGAALAIAGIDANFPDPEVGTILRRDDGTPTGVMLTLAQGLVNQHIPDETPDEIKASILLGLETMAQAGVTSVHEAGMPPARVQAFQELASEGRLPIRVYGMLDGNNDSLMTAWFERGPLIDPAGYFTVRSIKVFYDGSLGSRTALMAAPYSDDPHAANPTERITPAKVASLAERAAERGFQMAVHAIGDAGNDRVLDIYETALASHPNQDHRWRIEHAQVVLPSYYERATALDIISSMQPSHAVGDSKWAEARVGADRIQHAYAWRSIADAGGRILFNSDLPGEPWTPVETLYFGVTRRTLGGTPPDGWYAGQAFSVEESLHAMTVEGAYAAFQEHQIGSLAPGKLADFIELDANPLTTPPERLADLSVQQTWIGGARIPRP